MRPRKVTCKYCKDSFDNYINAMNHVCIKRMERDLWDRRDRKRLRDLKWYIEN